MDGSLLTSDDLAERGKAWYDRKIRRLVETEEKIGKVVVIDIERCEFGV